MQEQHITNFSLHLPEAKTRFCCSGPGLIVFGQLLFFPTVSPGQLELTTLAAQQALTCFSRTECFPDGWIWSLLTCPHRETSNLHRRKPPQTSATWSIHGTPAGSPSRCGCCGESPPSCLTSALRTATPGTHKHTHLSAHARTSCGPPDVIWQTRWCTLAAASVGCLINNK